MRAAGEVWICAETRPASATLPRSIASESSTTTIVHRLLGVGGEWVMSLRSVPD